MEFRATLRFRELKVAWTWTWNFIAQAQNKVFQWTKGNLSNDGKCQRWIPNKKRKISRRRSRSPAWRTRTAAEFSHFTLLFAEDGKEMYKDL